jgi:putative transposase
MSASTPLHYPSDLPDSQWALIEPLLPAPKSGLEKGGRPAKNQRQVVNGIFYVVKSGCQWRMLPREFGSWQTIFGYYNRWSKDGIWRKIMEELTRKERERQGRKAEPSAGCIDSQSVKAAMQPADNVGFDGGKKIKGRKRHVLTDTLGLILCVVVTSANQGDRQGLQSLIAQWVTEGRTRLQKIWVDGGYSGQPLRDWVRAIKRTHKIDLEVTQSEGKGFQVVAKRWVVERTFGWLVGYRRTSKDYEVLPRNSEAMIQICMTAILLRRLG